MTNNFHCRMIKARVAETIIKELFLVCGYDVFDYGMERSLPSIIGRLNNNNSDTAMQIRKMPDFVVQTPPPGNELFYVEVKYHKYGLFPSLSDDIKNYPYTNAWFIVVSQKDIRCISYHQIIDGMKIGSEDCLLENSKVFNLPKKTISQFKK